MTRKDRQRNLMLGVTALKLGLISPETLLVAYHSVKKTRKLDILGFLLSEGRIKKEVPGQVVSYHDTKKELPDPFEESKQRFGNLPAELRDDLEALFGRFKWEESMLLSQIGKVTRKFRLRVLWGPLIIGMVILAYFPASFIVSSLWWQNIGYYVCIGTFPSGAFELLDSNKEFERLSELITLPTGPGNAALDIYEACHRPTDGSNMPYPWFDEFYQTYHLSKEDPDAMKKLLEWSRTPELEVFRKAAGRGSYLMWGEVIEPFDGYIHPLFPDFSKLMMLGIIRAREMSEQGDTDGALAWYYDLLIIANHMESDPDTFMLCSTIGKKSRLSQELVNFYMIHDQPVQAARWYDYFDFEIKRCQAVREILRSHCLPSSDLIKILEHPELPQGIRYSVYRMLVDRCMYRTPWRVLVGPREEMKKYLLEYHFDNPGLEARKNFIDRKLNQGLRARLSCVINKIKEQRKLMAGRR